LKFLEVLGRALWKSEKYEIRFHGFCPELTAAVQAVLVPLFRG
jgi:hypothetical protein